MWGVILSFLKKAALKAATAAKVAAKAAIKHPFKTLAKATAPGQLYEAIKGGEWGKSMLQGGTAEAANQGQTANVAGMGEVPVAPADYYKSQQAQINPNTSQLKSPYKQGSAGTAGGMGMGGAGQGILEFLGQSGVGMNKPQDIQTSKPAEIIPEQYKQFMRQPGMTYVPGPEGSYVGGEGEVMPGYGFTNPLPPQKQDVGAIRGFIDALTGQPQPKGLSEASQGRKTAYYGGGVIPNIIMAKLGQPSPAESTSREYLNKYYQTGIPTYDPDEVSPGTNLPYGARAIRKTQPTEKATFQKISADALIKITQGENPTWVVKNWKENNIADSKKIDDAIESWYETGAIDEETYRKMLMIK